MKSPKLKEKTEFRNPADHLIEMLKYTYEAEDGIQLSKEEILDLAVQILRGRLYE